jgi:hypothetical protein
MQLPVTQDVILSELETAHRILEKWYAKTKEGIPGVDMPGSPDMLEDHLRSFCGELLLVAAKCENLAHVLMND